MRRIKKKQLIGRKLALALVGALLTAWLLAGCSSANSDGNMAADSAMNGGNAKSAESAATANLMQSSSSNASTDAANDAPAADGASTEAGVPAAGASFSETGDDTGSAVDRKIVYKGSVTMEVKAYAAAQTALRDLIHLSGGYLLKFSDQKTATETGGTYTVKVPASGFDGFLNGLEKIEHLSYQSSAEGTDVTEEYVDLQARLKARQVVEARLIDFMSKATKTADLLQISNQLGGVQTEIEQIKGRMRYLDTNVAYSTIDLRMYEVTKAAAQITDKEQGFADRIKEAAKGSVDVMYAFLQGVIVVLAGALPVLAVLAIVGVPSYVFYRNGRRKRAAQSAAARPALTAREEAGGDGKAAGDGEANGDGDSSNGKADR